MKKEKGDLTNPRLRILQISLAGNAKQLGSYKGTKAIARINPYAGEFEVVLEFFDDGNRSSYQVIGSKATWKKAIRHLKQRFREIDETNK